MIITIKPPKDVCKNLSVEGGLKPDSFHITLCFVDKSYDDDTKVVMNMAAALMEACFVHDPFICTINKLGKFENVKAAVDSSGHKVVKPEEPTDVIYAAVEGESLYTFRQTLADKLDAYEVPYSKIHKDFKGHISLIYVPHGDVINESVIDLPQEFEVNEIEIWASDKGEPIFSYKLKEE